MQDLKAVINPHLLFVFQIPHELIHFKKKKKQQKIPHEYIYFLRHLLILLHFSNEAPYSLKGKIVSMSYNRKKSEKRESTQSKWHKNLYIIISRHPFI